jgi:hypothetical protein
MKAAKTTPAMEATAPVKTSEATAAAKRDGTFSPDREAGGERSAG